VGNEDLWVGDRALAVKRQFSLKRYMIWLCFWIYMGGMIYFLFIGERYGNPYNDYRYNLILFQEIRRFVIYRDKIGMSSFLLNIFGNIFAFSPFGVFLPLLSQNMRKMWRVFGMSFLVTLCIECTQLVTRLGVFDVDDLVMNTLGGVIGYGIYCFYIRFSRAYAKRRMGRKRKG